MVLSLVQHVSGEGAHKGCSRKTQHASQGQAQRSGLSLITAERIEAAKLLAAGGVAGAASRVQQPH